MSVVPAGVVPAVSLELPALASSVPVIRASLRSFAANHGAGKALQGAIAIAVTEAAANVVVHAYPARRPGSVRVDADLEEDVFELVVVDHGHGFNVEAPPTGGLGIGLALMREHSGAFEIRDRPEGGIEAWMRFPLVTDAKPASDGADPERHATQDQSPRTRRPPQ